MTDTDAKYMKEAIRQAKKAYAIGEVPIGCVIVRDGKIISRGYNRRTIWIRIHWLMQSWRRSKKRVRN